MCIFSFCYFFHFGMQMKVIARKLVSNNQGGVLAVLRVSANQTMAQQSLGTLVVHAVATLISRSSIDFLSPLVSFVNDPGGLAVS